MKTKLGELTREDMTRMLAVYAPIKGIQHNPTAYSRQETEQAWVAYWRFMGEIFTKYNLDDTESWVVSEYSGLIYVDTSA